MRRCDNVGMHDLVIRGGKVVDGTGAAPVTADVAIDGDQIVAVGQVDQAGTRESRPTVRSSPPVGSTCTLTTTARPPGIP